MSIIQATEGLNSKFLESTTTGMWAMFILGVAVVMLYIARTPNSDEGAKKFFKLTWANIAFHIIASFAVFALVEEIGLPIIEEYVPVLKDRQWHLTFSFLTGALGGPFVAWILSKFNTKVK